MDRNSPGWRKEGRFPTFSFPHFNHQFSQLLTPPSLTFVSYLNHQDDWLMFHPVFLQTRNWDVLTIQSRSCKEKFSPKKNIFLHYSASVSVRNIAPMFSRITCQSGENKEPGAKKSTFETQSCGVCFSKTNVVIQY